ncbi:SlyX family protein [Denitrificimonas sp. JX-1]|uniref:Protein SlyX homolog n=1 Tax=Denitrificimonas halotolerans TaxID=3098930 RepID=A0ABU5GNN3_9GAMM|nr:SlyX family protein [Denitrificimonas sp. JX-1]MDY7218142.1 SlyX family protein [Denitrificimonas sp. JX-1]
MSIEERVAELEIRQAFQDDTIATLNDVIVEQQRLIARMETQLKLLAQRQVGLSNQFNETPNDPPPHY